MTIDKNAIKARMLELEHDELDHAIEAYEAYFHDSHLIAGETHDRDDEAMARMNADLAHSFDHPVQEHQAKIALIEDTDFGPKSEAERGAVVRFGGKLYVIATSTRRFTCGTQEFMGISMDSPAFQALKGLSTDESFTLNGREILIEGIW